MWGSSVLVLSFCVGTSARNLKKLGQEDILEAKARGSLVYRYRNLSPERDKCLAKVSQRVCEEVVFVLVAWI